MTQFTGHGNNRLFSVLGFGTASVRKMMQVSLFGLRSLTCETEHIIFSVMWAERKYA